jgi:hypothetical protein
MVAKELQMAGLFAANGEDWRRQRTLVMQAFNLLMSNPVFPRCKPLPSDF